VGDWAKEWLRESERRARKRDEQLAKISKNRKIMEVLQRYGSNQERLGEIFQLLVMAGLGERAAWKVIKNPKRLSQFFQMEADRVEFPEIVSRILK